MGEWLRSMDPTYRACLIIFIVVTLKGFLTVQWERFKAAQAKKVTPMRLNNGVYEPWGAVQRIERAFNWATVVWVGYMAFLICTLIYMKWNGWDRLF